jgi:hypothetical protein
MTSTTTNYLLDEMHLTSRRCRNHPSSVSAVSDPLTIDCSCPSPPPQLPSAVGTIASRRRPLEPRSHHREMSCRRRPPPHHCPMSSVSPSLHHLARRLPNTTLVLSLLKKIHRSLSHADSHHAPTVPGACPHCAEVPGQPGHFSFWARPLLRGREPQ